MQELTAITIWTETGFMKLQTRLGLEIGRHVSLLDELVVAVSERTRVLEFARPRYLPIPAHLSLKLRLILLHKLFAVTLTGKLLLWSLDSCHLFLILVLKISYHGPRLVAGVNFIELGSLNQTNAIILFINRIPIDSDVGHLFHRAGYINIFEFIFLIRRSPTVI